jgi:hypothetical protein
VMSAPAVAGIDALLPFLMISQPAPASSLEHALAALRGRHPACATGVGGHGLGQGVRAHAVLTGLRPAVIGLNEACTHRSS